MPRIVLVADLFTSLILFLLLNQQHQSRLKSDNNELLGKAAYATITEFLIYGGSSIRKASNL